MSKQDEDEENKEEEPKPAESPNPLDDPKHEDASESSPLLKKGAPVDSQEVPSAETTKEEFFSATPKVTKANTEDVSEEE